MTKNLINLDLIKIIQFCLQIYDLMRHSHLWVGVWVVGWMDGLLGGLMGGSMGGQITKNLELIKIIQFCFKIYDLWRHPTYGWLYGWLGG